jgi:hypothetical protein
MRRWGRVVLLAAGLCAASEAAWAGDVASAERDQRAGAQKTFEAGSKLYDSHHYEEALAAFRASYQIVSSPNSRLMIARCLRDLERIAEAYREYDAVAAEAAKSGDRYKSTAEAASEERDELKGKIAMLTVRVPGAPPELTVKVGQITLAPAEVGSMLPFDPGPVVITANTPDGAKGQANVTLAAGTPSEVELRLARPASLAAPVPVPAPTPAPVAPPTSSPTPLRTWAYVAGGVGGAGLITFAIFGVMTASKYSSLESACPGRVCPPGKQGDVDTGGTYQTVANVGLGVGLVGIAAGTTLFFLSRGHSNSDASVHVGVGLGRAELSGRF